MTLNPTTPTIYIVGGNGIDKNTNLIANNAMIYLSGTSATVSLNGGTSVSLNITTQFNTGTYAGISIFQARDDSTAWAIAGNPTMNVGGTIYAPAAQIVVSGNPGGFTGSQIIASSMTMNGNGNTVAYSGSAGNHAATRVLRLVE